MNIWPFSKSTKASTPVQHSGGGQQLVFLSNGLDTPGGYDYGKGIGAGLGSSLIMAPIQWAQRAMMEAPLIVEQIGADGEWEMIDQHPLELFLENPNPYYDFTSLLMGTLISYYTDGNAYWMHIFNGRGEPVELWYIPHWLITPIGSEDGTQFITHYQYTVNGKRYEVDPKQITHFRHGIDPQNPRLGVSPIDSAIKEIWTDMEAAEYIASLLRNNGIPGLIISPDNELSAPGPDDIETIKRYVKSRTTGSKRGEPMVLSGKTKVERVSWNPEEMNLSPASDRAEERVCSLMGFPAAVVGFSAGLQQTKVGATMSEMRKLAWWNGVIPVQNVIAKQVGKSLLPFFDNNKGRRAKFDNSDVAALQEDEDALFKRANIGVKGGWLEVGVAKKMVGLESGPEDNYYLRGMAMEAIPAGVPLEANTEEDEGLEEGEDMGEDQKSAQGASGKGNKTAHNHDLERLLAASASRADATDAQVAYIEFQERMALKLEKKLQKKLAQFFQDLGKQAAEKALAILGLKAIADDPLAASRIVEAMNMRDIIPIFASILETHYLLTAEESTALAMETIGLATDIPDHVARAIQATGGTRAGLIDLTAQTKKALFKAIEEGRAEGLGASALAKRIEAHVSAGPWSSVKIRGRVIARTETKYAQRISTLHLGKENGVAQFRVFDARLGLTDPDCEMLDGILVDAAQADELAASEHPNGTRDFVPHFG